MSVMKGLTRLLAIVLLPQYALLNHTCLTCMYQTSLLVKGILCNINGFTKNIFQTVIRGWIAFIVKKHPKRLKSINCFTARVQQHRFKQKKKVFPMF